jgi:Cys-rich repeat protein
MKPSGLFSFFPLLVIVLTPLAGCTIENHDPWEEGDWGPQGRGGSSGSQPPGSVGSPCARDNDCGSGCYCTREGARVCRHSGNCQRDEHCASGFRCDERRTCVPRDTVPSTDAGTKPEVGPGGAGGAGGSGGKDAGVPETPPSGTGGAAGTGTGGTTGMGGSPGTGGNGATGGTGGGVAPISCRADAQCGGGRCVQGGCQRPCGADASCGTGHVCKEGYCQPSTQPGGQCLYSAECPAGGTCINGYCHAACAAVAAVSTNPAPATCPNPADRCLQGVCKPDVRPVPQCTANAHCPAGRSCVDAVCRTPCRDDSQCGPGCSGTVCHAGYCVMPEELQPPPTCPMPCAATTCCPVQKPNPETSNRAE